MFIANVDYLMSFMIENLGDQMTKVTDRFQKPTKLVMAGFRIRTIYLGRFWRLV